MKNQLIQVLGSGCPACKQLLETVEKIVSALSIDAEVEYITDVAKIIEMGVMASPVLAIDGKIVLTGKGRSEEEIRNILTNNPAIKKDCDDCRSCCCGCK